MTNHNSQDLFTSREEQILKFIAIGHSTKQIADLFLISPLTVRKHRANILAKLKLSSSAGLISYAVHHFRGCQVGELKYIYLLTGRELQILNLLSEGLTAKMIAQKLSISFHTVEKHKENIYKKLKIERYSAIFLDDKGS